MQHISAALPRIIQKMFNEPIEAVLTRPDEQFGDYSTNIALQLAKKVGKNPRDIAEQIAEELRAELGELIAEVTVAGPGFVNIKLNNAALFAQAQAAVHTKPQIYANKVVVAEYSDPNPFKQLHAGHLYTTIVGDVIANLVEAAGATVHRVNFGGDVGLHVARTMYGMRTAEGDDAHARAKVDELAAQPLAERLKWISERYRDGNSAYERDETAKQQIVELNKKVYQLHESGDKTSDFAHIYWTCRAWSYEYFDAFYREIGVKPFEKYYPESETAPIGVQIVTEQFAKGVYTKSDGAIVFDGEKYGLHTRVFINSAGLPTYETKDVGLSIKKWQDYHFDQSIIITGDDIIEYMKVVLKSIEQFEPELAERTVHLTHGQVKLEGGVKMSSRLGNGLNATDILQAAEQAAAEMQGKPDKQTAYAAVKYSFLKQRLGGDIIYLPKESVALEGNSGPYLQYAHARARSILTKAGEFSTAQIGELDAAERSLARKISEYPEIVAKAIHELLPHHICTYLYELSQTFNRFYEKSRVIGDERQALRLQLVGLYADVLKDGLELLDIAAPERL